MPLLPNDGDVRAHLDAATAVWAYDRAGEHLRPPRPRRAGVDARPALRSAEEAVRDTDFPALAG